MTAPFEYARFRRALAITDNDHAAGVEFACSAYGRGSMVATVLKAGVGADGVTTAAGGYFQNVQAEFMDAVFDLSIPGRSPSLRYVPLLTPLINITGSATARWVGEHKLRPLSKVSFGRASLKPKRVASMIALTLELLRSTDPKTDATVQRDMVNAMVLAINQAFIDSSNAGDTETPAAVTNGITPITATGDPRVDIAALVEHYDGDPQTGMWVMHPKTAVQLALTGDLVFADLGLRGGTLMGAPAVTSIGVPYSSGGSEISLIDPAGIMFGRDQVEFSSSQNATLAMDDDPNTGTPATVSMFQTDCIALMTAQWLNWERVRSGAVALLTGADYTGRT
jgi:hypothetical protein